MIDTVKIALDICSKQDTYAIITLSPDKVPTRQEQLDSQKELDDMISQNAAARFRSSKS